MLLMSEDRICLIEESSDTFLIPSLLILLIDVKFQMFGGLSLSVSVCVFFLTPDESDESDYPGRNSDRCVFVVCA